MNQFLFFYETRTRKFNPLGRSNLLIPPFPVVTPLTNSNNVVLFFFWQDGRTALHLAASAGHTEVTSALILAGAPIGALDSVNLIPIYISL